jgi:hypothetical protein
MSNKKNNNEKIDKIAKTDQKITGRGGLSLFVNYLSGIAIYPILKTLFGWVKGSSKGTCIEGIFKQLFCFFIDGTSNALTRFDELKSDEGYASTIESKEDALCSSHSIKRFFKKFCYAKMKLFRRLLLKLFLWRLRLKSPDVVILDIDSFILDNDNASKREGCEPTYMNKKGYQPLGLKWDGFMIDSIFRRGSKHGNYEREAFEMIKKVVKLIRKNYKENVPIIVTSDSGFFDKKNFNDFDDLGIGFICSGKFYDDLKGRIRKFTSDKFNKYYNGNAGWLYCEFSDRRKSWDTDWRCIYTCKEIENKQLKFDFAKEDSLIYTNLGMTDSQITEFLDGASQDGYKESEEIIELFHGRGREELVHRGVKDFGSEKLRFKRFEPNAAYYFVMLVAFFLFECYKRDVTYDKFNIRGYASRFRRQLIDFGAKLVKTGGQKILKIPESIFKRINAAVLWERCKKPPRLSFG